MLAVLDLDNLIAPWWEREDDEVCGVVEGLLAVLPSEATIVGACTHRVARRLAALSLPDTLDRFERVSARPEAADKILLGALRSWPEAPVGAVWIASGDRRFAGATGRARRAGHQVVVVAPLAGLSPQLLRRADRLFDLRREHAVEVTHPVE